MRLRKRWGRVEHHTGCARRSPAEATEDAGSIPATSTRSLGSPCPQKRGPGGSRHSAPGPSPGPHGAITCRPSPAEVRSRDSAGRSAAGAAAMAGLVSLSVPSAPAVQYPCRDCADERGREWRAPGCESAHRATPAGSGGCGATVCDIAGPFWVHSGWVLAISGPRPYLARAALFGARRSRAGGAGGGR